MKMSPRTHDIGSVYICLPTVRLYIFRSPEFNLFPFALNALLITIMKLKLSFSLHRYSHSATQDFKSVQKSGKNVSTVLDIAQIQNYCLTCFGSRFICNQNKTGKN